MKQKEARTYRAKETRTRQAEKFLGKPMTKAEERIIVQGVKRTIKEYGKALKLMGNE